MIHLTEKPVELSGRALDYSARPGENVLDLFGGSGSTLIACAQAGRNGFLMELGPALLRRHRPALRGLFGSATAAAQLTGSRPGGWLIRDGGLGREARPLTFTKHWKITARPDLRSEPVGP
jgi:hypothetical protein